MTTLTDPLDEDGLLDSYKNPERWPSSASQSPSQHNSYSAQVGERNKKKRKKK
jgi:hypothetical protein